MRFQQLPYEPTIIVLADRGSVLSGADGNAGWMGENSGTKRIVVR